jgi:hypothetical protein
MKTFLQEQHYPKNLIMDGINKATEINRQELINPTPKTDEGTKILPLITTHNPKNLNITPAVRSLNKIF